MCVKNKSLPQVAEASAEDPTADIIVPALRLILAKGPTYSRCRFWASHASGSGKDTFLLQIGRRDRYDLVGSSRACASCFACSGLPTITRVKGVRTRVDRHAVAYELEHHLIAGQQSLASALTYSASYQCCRRSLPPPQTSRRSFAGCRVQSLVSSASELRREDKCELGLLLQRSESQRWPAPNSNSRLIACIAGPAIRASAPMVLHTPALVEHRSGTLTPADLIPVTNTIERPNEKFKRPIKIRPFVISGRHGNIVLGCSPPAR